ncbi:PepSY domain-containing protein [Corynebacterium variabile]|uniref:Putative secreted protein n=1 Tax=Corynebacterium variabile (strain DSM 44702 / CIP 107183 / JCM 12073 / NCIMB 30131) TaxID=858619 RepID=G0HA45_CORVD|nr:PepSY domain-containing protein [Corynebacterium variabile]AEK36061.1 putative secreted protein [Corynebacterium variabile DSM 44702]MDN6662297.1 PepSY domain-containing protein [Corynebacterium variabile]
MNSRYTRTTLAALTASVLSVGALAACGDDSDDAKSTVTVTQSAPADNTSGSDSTAATTTSQSDGSGSSDHTDARTSAVDAAGALEAALDAKPGSYAVEVDEEDGRAWEITLVADGKGVEVTVDNATGEVTGEQSTDLDAEQREAPSVTAAEAVDAALAEKPGTLDSLDLDQDNGTIVWDATVIDGTREWDIVIDASSGDILRANQDD